MKRACYTCKACRKQASKLSCSGCQPRALENFLQLQCSNSGTQYIYISSGGGTPTAMTTKTYNNSSSSSSGYRTPGSD